MLSAYQIAELQGIADRIGVAPHDGPANAPKTAEEVYAGFRQRDQAIIADLREFIQRANTAEYVAAAAPQPVREAPQQGAGRLRHPAPGRTAAVRHRVTLNGVPDEVAAAVLPTLEVFLLWFAPRWLRVLSVRFRNDDTPGEEGRRIADLEGLPEYGTAALTVYAEWMHEDAWGRALGLAHEVAHLVLEPLVKSADKAVETLAPGDAMAAARDLAHDANRRAYETAVVDLADAMYAMLEARFTDGAQ